MAIDALLIANRGEIACRIIRTCRRLGVRAVAVYSDADADARHVRLADEAIHIGPAAVGASYLNGAALIAAARRAGADAVHPGYGFLAENADFARACAAAGLIFVGPTPEAIATMGNKRAAKELAAACGVSIIPGYGGADQSDGRFQSEAARIGYPVMVKAAAGGGGKGMRLVNDPAALPEALAVARREARQAFGDDELLLEKALPNPRHVEIQLFGDRHGHLIHLGERECSLQRRHQKIVEETPSPAVTPELRARMGAAAVALAQAIDYTNAGTAEFLLDAQGDFYFLEMNTRLQVEHPVTEMVTGLDLVEWQIRVAEGAPLPLTQAQVRLRGHAVEARLYAENPANDFLPVTGAVARWRAPRGDGVRVESGILAQDQVSRHYDPLLVKLVAHGPDRPTAVRKLRRALETAVLLGLTTNQAFLLDVLRHPAFLTGATDTHLIPTHFGGWQPPSGDLTLALCAAALIRFRRHPQPAVIPGYWRNNPNQPLRYRFAAPNGVWAIHLTPPNDREEAFRARLHPPEPETVPAETTPAHTLRLHALAPGAIILSLDGHRQRVPYARRNDRWWLQTGAGVAALQALPRLPQPHPPADAGGSLRAPLPGAVLAVLVAEGERVAEGQALLKLEAMKMEHTIRTAAAGIVTKIFYQVGDAVEADAQLVQIEELEG
jgi:geranyl-CoA carboxylase alpha subunit